MPEPVAPLERPPGFSAPPRPTGRGVGRNDGKRGRRPRAADSGEAQHPPVISTGRNTHPSFRPGAYPLPSFRPKRSEWRNPAGDGRRADAGACGVDGAPSGFLHSAPKGAPVEMTARGGGGRAPPLGAKRNTQPSFRPKRTPFRHFDRAERVEKSGRRRAPGGRRSLWLRRSALRVSPLRPGPEGRASGRNDGRGGGGRAPPLGAKRNTQPSFRPKRTPFRHFDRAERVEKSGRRRAPGGGQSLRRRWSARRISPLRLRSEPALSEAEGAGYSAPPGGPGLRSK